MNMRMFRRTIASASNLRHAALLGLVAASLPLTASALELPQRKEGLWQLTTSGTSGPHTMPPTTILQCVDAAVDKSLQSKANGAMGEMKCEVNEIKKDGDKYVGRQVCRMGTSKMEASSVTSGDFSKEYKVMTEAKFDPPMMGVTGSKNVIQAKWLGACKADQKPGDVIMPNGQKINMGGAAK